MTWVKEGCDDHLVSTQALALCLEVSAMQVGKNLGGGCFQLDPANCLPEVQASWKCQQL